MSDFLSVHNVAFTIFGWRDNDSSIRLYLDGRLVGDSTNQQAGVDSVHSSTHRIVIGNNQAMTTPFHGQMTKPLLMSISLTNEEILRELRR